MKIDVFEAMSDTYRQRVLQELHSRGSAELPLVMPEDVASEMEDLDRLSVILHHTHLPKLDQLGFIEYDPNSQTVVRGQRFDELRPVLRLDSSHD